MNKKYMRIFNMRQANFLYQNGCQIINLGYGSLDGVSYVRFLANDKFKQCMLDWQNKTKEYHKNK